MGSPWSWPTTCLPSTFMRTEDWHSNRGRKHKRQTTARTYDLRQGGNLSHEPIRGIEPAAKSETLEVKRGVRTRERGRGGPDGRTISPFVTTTHSKQHTNRKDGRAMCSGLRNALYMQVEAERFARPRMFAAQRSLSPRITLIRKWAGEPDCTQPTNQTRCDSTGQKKQVKCTTSLSSTCWSRSG